jgi:hypothetical protein
LDNFDFLEEICGKNDTADLKWGGKILFEKFSIFSIFSIFSMISLQSKMIEFIFAVRLGI